MMRLIDGMVQSIERLRSAEMQQHLCNGAINVLLLFDGDVAV